MFPYLGERATRYPPFSSSQPSHDNLPFITTTGYIASQPTAPLPLGMVLSIPLNSKPMAVLIHKRLVPLREVLVTPDSARRKVSQVLERAARVHLVRIDVHPVKTLAVLGWDQGGTPVTLQGLPDCV